MGKTTWRTALARAVCRPGVVQDPRHAHTHFVREPGDLVASQRYERGATIVTSNLPFQEWTSVFASERKPILIFPEVENYTTLTFSRDRVLRCDFSNRTFPISTFAMAAKRVPFFRSWILSCQIAGRRFPQRLRFVNLLDGTLRSDAVQSG